MFDNVKNSQFQIYLSAACALVLYFHSLVENLLGVSGFTSAYPAYEKSEGRFKHSIKHAWYFYKIPLVIYLWTALNGTLFFIFLLALKYMVLDVAKGEVMSDFSSITFDDLKNIAAGAFRARLGCVAKNIVLGHVLITTVFLMYARPSKMHNEERAEAMTRAYFVMLLLHSMIVLLVEFVL
jgi:hypothetical protein